MPESLPTTVLDRIAAAARCSGTWCVHVALGFDAPLDAERLRRATARLLVLEPVLGSRLDEGPRQPVWVRAGREAYLAIDDAAWDATIRTPIDLAVGPAIRVAHAGARLLVTASHAVTDGGGVVHLLQRLAALYRDPDAALPPADADRGLGVLWRALPWRQRLAALSNAGDRLRTVRTAFPSHQLRIPDDGAPTDTLFLTRELASEPLVAYARARGATVNDLLQAAMLRALVAVQPWDGSTALTLNSTVDLRRYLPGGRAGAVCNLSTGTLSTLGRDLGASLDDTLAAVAARSRAAKERGLGLSVEVVGLPFAALVPYARIRAGIERTLAEPRDGRRPADSLSNVGAVDPEALGFDDPPRSLMLLPQFLHPTRYQVVSFAFRGRTWLVSGVWPSEARERRVAALFDAMVAELSAAAATLEAARSSLLASP